MFKLMIFIQKSTRSKYLRPRKAMLTSRGISLFRKSVRDSFITKGFLRIFGGLFLKKKDFCPRCTRFLGSEMPLGLHKCPANKKPNFKKTDPDLQSNSPFYKKLVQV